jgi:broad specificity phosphatase PhoE
MNQLILVRHSQSDAQPDVPSHEWGLTAEGQRRAAILAEQLAPYAPFALASSPEPKARQTADTIADRFIIPVIEHPDLREHDRRTVDWMDTREDYLEANTRFFANPKKRVLGEESAAEALDRFSRALREILDAYPEENVVAVTHGSVITLFIARITGEDPYSLWQSLTQPWHAVIAIPRFKLIESVAFREDQSL